MMISEAVDAPCGWGNLIPGFYELPPNLMIKCQPPELPALFRAAATVRYFDVLCLLRSLRSLALYCIVQVCMR